MDFELLDELIDRVGTLLQGGKLLSCCRLLVWIRKHEVNLGFELVHCHWLSRSVTRTGACRTYFPRPQTRCVDPGSILRDQNKGLIRQPELGCKHQMLASVHHHIQYLICIYTSDQHWEVTPVWKSTKISVSGLFTIIILKELSVLDT